MLVLSSVLERDRAPLHFRVSYREEGLRLRRFYHLRNPKSRLAED